MKRSITAISALVFAMIGTAPAQATTYIGTRNVGAATAQLSITTDGTLGVLQFGNITDWTIGLSDPTHSITLLGPLSGNNSTFVIEGSALSATANQLLFDFNRVGGFAFFPKPPNNNDGIYCVVASDVNCGFGRSSENILFGNANYAAARNSVVVLATAVSGPGGVPEPASWALMIAGFGLTGAAMRRRTVRVKLNPSPSGEGKGWGMSATPYCDIFSSV